MKPKRCHPTLSKCADYLITSLTVDGNLQPSRAQRRATVTAMAALEASTKDCKIVFVSNHICFLMMLDLDRKVVGLSKCKRTEGTRVLQMMGLVDSSMYPVLSNYLKVQVVRLAIQGGDHPHLVLLSLIP